MVRENLFKNDEKKKGYKNTWCREIQMEDKDLAQDPEGEVSLEEREGLVRWEEYCAGVSR